MRVQVEQTRCQGHARCWQELPEVFELDAEGYCAISEADVPAGSEPAARRAADGCPERVITVVE